MFVTASMWSSTYGRFRVGKDVTLDDVLGLVERLSVIDKVRLIEAIAPQIERELERPRPVARTSLRGLWKGVDVTDEDIAEVRQEMWSGFPRDNL